MRLLRFHFDSILVFWLPFSVIPFFFPSKIYSRLFIKFISRSTNLGFDYHRTHARVIIHSSTSSCEWRHSCVVDQLDFSHSFAPTMALSFHHFYRFLSLFFIHTNFFFFLVLFLTIFVRTVLFLKLCVMGSLSSCSTAIRFIRSLDAD